MEFSLIMETYSGTLDGKKASLTCATTGYITQGIRVKFM